MRRFQPMIIAVSFFAMSFVIGTEAAAVRRCEEDPAITGRTCSEAECITLQAIVKSISACGGGGNPPPVGCDKVDGCEEMKRQLQRWRNCFKARKTINMVCWDGGNEGHVEQLRQVLKVIKKCERLIELPRPVGCGEPCP